MKLLESVKQYSPIATHHLKNPSLPGMAAALFLKNLPLHSQGSSLLIPTHTYYNAFMQGKALGRNSISNVARRKQK